MTILTVGIDLAKNVCAMHGMNAAGKAALVRAAVPRDKWHALIAALLPCVTGLEACPGAHHWAQLFRAPHPSATSAWIIRPIRGSLPRACAK